MIREITGSKKRAKQDGNPGLALTNPNSSNTLKGSHMLSDFNKTKYKRTFDKSKLPTPILYYTERNHRLSGNGKWKSTICPFHEDTKPSLTVNVENGAFKCFSCGAKGGDVLAFHRLVNDLSFAEAVTDLDAWEAA